MKIFRKLNIKFIIIVLMMTVVLGLTGCNVGGKKLYFSTGLSEDDLFKIDGSVLKISEAKLYLTTEKNLYEKSYGSEIWDKNMGEITLESYVKESVKNQLAEIKTLDLLAKEKKVKLNKEENAKAKEAAKTFFDGLTKGEKKYLGVTQKSVEEAYKNHMLANKCYNELTKDINPEISDSEAKMIKVASIYYKTYTVDKKGNRTEYTEDEKEKSKKSLERLLKNINDGQEDFMTAAANNTDADQVEYVFGKGDMIKEFEDTAFKLKTDEISGIVDTPDGYYVILCINDYLEDETNKRKEEMVINAKDEYFKSIYEPFVESLSSEFNDKEWDKISFDKMKDIKVSNFYECIV